MVLSLGRYGFGLELSLIREDLDFPSISIPDLDEIFPDGFSVFLVSGVRVSVLVFGVRVSVDFSDGISVLLVFRFRASSSCRIGCVSLGFNLRFPSGVSGTSPKSGPGSSQSPSSMESIQLYDWVVLAGSASIAIGSLPGCLGWMFP